MSETDYNIKSKFGHIIELLLLKGHLNDWNAEWMLKLTADKIEEESKFLDDLELDVEDASVN